MKGNKEKPSRLSRLELRVQEMARRKAKRQAQKVRWERLLQARSEYIEWEMFGFWVCLIIETEGDIPEWLQRIIEARCPAFLESERRHREARPGGKVFPSSRLSQWIECNIFGDAHEQDWMLAITFYAVRDFRYHRAWSYWRHCDELWKQKRPVSYPSFDQWRRAAEQWDAKPPAGASIRKGYEAYKRVNPQRLSEAVERYIDWETFAYWTRSALEGDGKLPEVVADELRRRCPGFLEHDEQLRKTDVPGKPQAWNRLFLWGEYHLFGEAKKDDWFDAMILYAHRHPRDVRMMEYWVRWSDRWRGITLASYPGFEEWRQAADNYVVDPSDDDEG